MSRRAFVTGATGFLGLNLVETLIAAGWEVTALHRPSSDVSGLSRYPARRVVGTIEDAPSLLSATPDGLDAFFHVAADVSFWTPKNARQTRTNVEGTRHAVSAAMAKGAKRFLHVSSIAVYGFQPPFDESAPQLGRSSWINYYRTKALAEEEVRDGIARGLDAVILNPANIVGKYDKNNWARLFTLIRDGKLPAVPPGRSSFCSGAAVAEALVAAVTRGKTGENYLLGGTDARYLDAVTIIGELIGKPVPKRPAPAVLVKAAAKVMDWASRITRKEPDITPEIAAMLSAEQVCISAKAVRELGYRTVPLRDMFEECHRWLVAAGTLVA